MAIFNDLDKILQIKEEIRQLDYTVEERKQLFEETLARQKEHFERMQEVERAQYEKEQNEFLGYKNDCLSREKRFLNQVFFIRLGNLKNQLMQHFGINENDISIKVMPLDSIRGECSHEARTYMVKSNPKYKGIIDVDISIWKLGIYYNMRYKMYYNMEQADGLSFIDHCYSENKWDVLDDSGMMSMLCVSPDCLDDIFIKIPYKALVLEAGRDEHGAIHGNRNREYYWNTPLDVFASCVINCLDSEKDKENIKK